MNKMQWKLEKSPALVGALAINDEDRIEASRIRSIIDRNNPVTSLTKDGRRQLAMHGLRIAITDMYKHHLDTLRGSYELNADLNCPSDGLVPIIEGAVRDTRLRRAGLLRDDQCIGSMSRFTWHAINYANSPASVTRENNDLLFYDGRGVARLSGSLEITSTNDAGVPVYSDAKYEENFHEALLDISIVMFDRSDISDGPLYVRTGHRTGTVTIDIEQAIPDSIVHGMTGAPLQKLIEHPFFSGVNVSIDHATVESINGRNKLRVDVTHNDNEIPIVLPSCKRLEGVISVAEKELAELQSA